MKEAYITALSNDAYLKGVLALYKTLRDHSDKEFLVMVSRAVSNYTIDILRKRKIQYKLCSPIVPDVDFENSRFWYWKYTFFKLNMWSLTEYDKLVYLDCDMLVLDNVDELFQREDMSAVADRDFDFWRSESKGLNSGCLVIKPNMTVYNNLIKQLNNVFDRPKVYGDQDIINEVFPNWGGQKQLPVDYNAHYHYIHLYHYEAHLKIVHFALSPKPWNEKFGKLAARLIANTARKRWLNVKVCLAEMKAYKKI